MLERWGAAFVFGEQRLVNRLLAHTPPPHAAGQGGQRAAPLGFRDGFTLDRRFPFFLLLLDLRLIDSLQQIIRHHREIAVIQQFVAGSTLTLGAGQNDNLPFPPDDLHTRQQSLLGR
ncbi:hypothetical protein ES705_44653 [subsurface metagenome]